MRKLASSISSVLDSLPIAVLVLTGTRRSSETESARVALGFPLVFCGLKDGLLSVRVTLLIKGDGRGEALPFVLLACNCACKADVPGLTLTMIVGPKERSLKPFQQEEGKRVLRALFGLHHSPA